MSEFRIFETDQFQEELERISPDRRDTLQIKLREFVYPQLRREPFFGKNIKKLRDFKPEAWRYGIGAYRFFYGIDERDKIVFMVAAEARQGSYR